MATFLFSAYFGSHFCYHSNSKNRINYRLLHLGYCFNKLIRKKTCEKQISFFCLKGGGGGKIAY